MPGSTSTARTKLPAREAEICRRLKEAREHIGLSQERFAAEAGIPKSSLGNYELCRTPLRCELAVRICRQFILSEEWLATGSFDAVHQAWPQLKLNTAIGRQSLGDVFMRQCMDLASEPICRHIPHGALFSFAYDEFLAPVYAALIRKFKLVPRIVLTDFDSEQITLNLIDVYSKRWFKMLGNEAARLKREAGPVQRQFLRCLLKTNSVIFKGFMGQPRPEIRGREYDFLRAVVSDEDYPIGLLHGTSDPPRD